MIGPQNCVVIDLVLADLSVQLQMKEGRQVSEIVGRTLYSYISPRTNPTSVSSVPTLLPSSIRWRVRRTAVSCLHCSATCNWIACRCESGWVRNMQVHRQKEKREGVVNNGACLPRRHVISTHTKRECSKEMLLLWENICLAYQESEVSCRNISHRALQLALQLHFLLIHFTRPGIPNFRT